MTLEAKKKNSFEKQELHSTFLTTDWAYKQTLEENVWKQEL